MTGVADQLKDLRTFFVECGPPSQQAVSQVLHSFTEYAKYNTTLIIG